MHVITTRNNINNIVLSYLKYSSTSLETAQVQEARSRCLKLDNPSANFLQAIGKVIVVICQAKCVRALEKENK